MSEGPCAFCGDPTPHIHERVYAPNGDLRDAVLYCPDDARAEVRDPDSGEVIFPAVKGPLRLIEGGRLADQKVRDE